MSLSALQQSAALYASAASSIYALAMARFSERKKTGVFPKQDSKEFNEMMGDSQVRWCCVRFRLNWR
jgi:predicted NodU family carbamoyl transferase